MSTDGKHEVTLRLLGRSLPVVVAPDEEAALTQAVQIIEHKIAGYRKSFAMNDEAYLLLMCCLEFATDNVNLRQENEQHMHNWQGKLGHLNQLVDDALLRLPHTVAA